MALVHPSLQMLLPLVLSDDYLLAHVALERLVATTSRFPSYPYLADC